MSPNQHTPAKTPIRNLTPRPIRILLVINGFYPKLRGAERQAQTLLRTLQAIGHRCIVVTTRFNNSLPTYEDVQGLPVHRLSYFKIPVLGRLQILAKLLLFLIRHAATVDGYLVVLIDYMALPTILTAKLFGKPVILKHTGLASHGTKYLTRGLLGSILCKAAKLADYHVYLNSAMREELINLNLPRRKLVYVPNGVDTDLFAPIDNAKKADTRQSLSIPQDSFVGLFVGALVHTKGPHTLIKAWAAANRDTHKHALILIGEGPMKEDLQRLAAREAIARHVAFLGRTEQVWTFFQAADVFILPSFSEGMSNTLLEAMSSGLPVIATNIPGNSEVVTHGLTGFLCPPNDVVSMAALIRDLRLSPDTRLILARNARRHVLTNYSILQVACSYIDLFTRNER